MARLANQMKQLYAMCATALVMGRADLDGADDVGFDIELPIFTVGQTAELANIHPQTLRQYDRLGLVRPQRTDGGARRYYLRDIARLTRAQRLSQDEGINLSGIARILVLEEENRQLRREVKRMQTGDQESVFAAGRDGNIVEAVWMPAKRFVWAVQWHPEFSHRADSNQRRILSVFIDAC